MRPWSIVCVVTIFRSDKYPADHRSVASRPKVQTQQKRTSYQTTKRGKKEEKRRRRRGRDVGKRYAAGIYIVLLSAVIMSSGGESQPMLTADVKNKDVQKIARIYFYLLFSFNQKRKNLLMSLSRVICSRVQLVFSRALSRKVTRSLSFLYFFCF